jgi:hypothetical protein
VLNLYDGLVDVSKIDIEMGMQEQRHPRYAPRYGVKVLINQFNGLAYDVFVHRFAPLLITSVLAGDLLSLVSLASKHTWSFRQSHSIFMLRAYSSSQPGLPKSVET